MGPKDVWHRLRMIWNFAVGVLIGGAGVAAYFFGLPPIHPIHPTPAQVTAAHVGSSGPPPGAGPPPGWHFVPNGVGGCADKYGCARPSFDSDFWEWVTFGEKDCADEYGCARPWLPGESNAPPPQQAKKNSEELGKKGEKPEAESESGARSQPGGDGAIPAGHELPSQRNQIGAPTSPPESR